MLFVVYVKCTLNNVYSILIAESDNSKAMVCVRWAGGAQEWRRKNTIRLNKPNVIFHVE